MDTSVLKSAAERVTKIRANVLLKQPFFGRLLMRLSLGFCECETAFTDTESIGLDPYFVQRISDEEIEFVLLHELLHCALKHCTRGENKHKLLYNIACDAVVNSLLLDVMGEEEMTVDGVPVVHLAPNGKEAREYSAEEVYFMLIKETPARLSELYVAGGAGEEDNGDGESGSGSSDGKADCRGGENASRGTDGKAGGSGLDKVCIDSHGAWDRIKPDSLAEEKWERNVAKASKEAGSMPLGIKRIVDKITSSHTLDWRKVLRDYIEFSRNDYSMLRPDRRFSGDIILPSFCENEEDGELRGIFVAVDASGSVGKVALSSALAEIKDAAEQVGGISGYLSFFDCEATVPVPFEDVDELYGIPAVGGGGTSFKCVFDRMDSFFGSALPEVVLIITDGYAEFPEESAAMGINVIWLIVNSEVVPPFGEYLHLKI